MNQHTIKHITTEFLVRMGWSRADAIKENDFLWATANTPVLEAHYYKTPRIGSSKQLTRAGKLSVWLTFQNAINHAEFQV